MKNNIDNLITNIHKRKNNILDKSKVEVEKYEKYQIVKSSYYYDGGYFSGTDITMGILNPDTPQEVTVYNTLFYKAISINIPEDYIPFLTVNIITNKSCNFDLKTTSIYNIGAIADDSDSYMCNIPATNDSLTGISSGSSIVIEGEYFITKISENNYILDIFTVTEKTTDLQLKYIITVGNLL